MDLKLFFPDLANNLKHNDPWLQKPSDKPLAHVLLMTVNGKVSGNDAHKKLTSEEIENYYQVILKTPLQCVVTGVDIIPYSGTGLNKLSPDRLHSNLPVDHPQQMLQRVSYFYQK